MHILGPLTVFGLYLASGALAAIIAPPPLQARVTAAAPEPTPTPTTSTTSTTTTTDPCAPDPFCDPAWPPGSVSVVTDTAAGACTPVLSTRAYSHVCGRTTWTTTTVATRLADCGACAVGTLAPLSYTLRYHPGCPLGGHHTVSTAVAPYTQTTWFCSATATAA